MTKLREHMLQDLLQAGRAESTRKAYINAIREYAIHFARCPSELGPDEVRTWVQHLRNSVLKPDRIRQHLAALKFLYAKTLGRPEMVAFLTFPSTPRKLAPVLSVEEVERVLGALEMVKYRVLFTTMYAAGLRITEVCQLKITDIDADRGVIHVRCAKGKKERLVMLPPRLLTILRAYWVQERPPKPWLFVSTRDPSKPIVVSTTRKAFEHATLVARLSKKATPHALRHTFCSHLAMRGAAPKAIQELVGHSTLTMTLRYMHLAPSALCEAIDLLNFGQPVGSALSRSV